jgi:hypothetical protein
MTYRPARVLGGLLVISVVAATALSAGAGPALATARPNLVTGSAYLVAPANLIHGHYYQSFPGYADFGLTIDGALALAATGRHQAELKGIVGFLDSRGKDPHGGTVNRWTGIGTRAVSGGSIGAEALLAEATGYNPRRFGGHDLVAALNASVCARASAGKSTRCPGAGSYSNAASVFDQALGIIAQLRTGQANAAITPIRYLESLRNAGGSFPSLIPNSHDKDVDSTALAVMALALVPAPAAQADVKAGLTWIASKQEKDGGFPGASGDSVNSAGLAVQALNLEKVRYRRAISSALGFLAAEQNRNGGFNPDAHGQRGSDIRASTEAVGGAVGISLGELFRNLGTVSAPKPPAPTPAPTPTRSPSPAPTVTITQQVAVTLSPSQAPAKAPLVTPTPQPSTQLSAPPSSQPAQRLAAADSDSSLTTNLWWTVIGVAVAAAAVIAALYLRRRRLYPDAGKRA